MRPLLVVGGLIGLIALALPVRGQGPPGPPGPLPSSTPLPTAAAPDFGTIIQPEVEVRCGGPQFPVTGKLRQNDRVQVVRESTEFPGYLAIKPPPGSFSWINGNFVLDPNVQRQGIVDRAEDADVPVLVGSTLTPDQPGTVTVANVKRGYIPHIIGNPVKTDTGTWVKIAPTPSEVRFIPKAAVHRYTTNVQTTVAPLSPAGTQVSSERQILQMALDKATTAESRQYFLMLLSKLPPDGNTQQIGSTPRPQMTLGPAPGIQAPGSTALYNGQNPAGGPQWSQYGILKKTAIPADGQAMYVLENKGIPILYVIPTPGCPLEVNVTRTVTCYGTVTYRSDEYLRNYVMIATACAVAP